MRIFKRFLLLSFLSCLSLSAYADNSGLVFSVQPTAQDMAINGTQTLTYTVQSNVPGPQPINKMELTSNAGSTTTVTSQISNSCNSLVPANGTCNIVVKLNASQTAGYVNNTLHIFYSGRNIDLSAPVTFTVSGSAPAATLVFVTQPTTPQTIASGASTTLTYQIQNTSSVAALYQANASPTDTGLMTATITSDVCGGTINPGQTCTIDVQAIAHTVTATEYDAVEFTVKYGVTTPLASTLTATAVEFTINTASADLSFVPPNPLVPNLTPGETGSPLVFTLSNSSGSPVAITPTVTSSPYDTVTSLTNSCGGSVPAGVGTCTVS
ncbi:MAG: hypothetical protein ACK4PR_05295, partial [Gammaproteobacteria bacterium]